MNGRVMLWCSNEPMEHRLAHELAKNFDLVGMVIEKRRPRSNLTLRKVFFGVLNKLLFYHLVDKAWIKTQLRFKNEFAEFPDGPKIFVDNINEEATEYFLKAHSPELVAVSGTALVCKKLLGKKPKIGIVNLHTGLSPYIKGGPNCTNWCLARGLYHLMGNTVMWLDAGIDSGNIISTKLVIPRVEWSHADLLYNVVRQGQNLYIEAVSRILEGKFTNNVPQRRITKGMTFYNRQWNTLTRLSLVINFYFGNYRKWLITNKVVENKIVTVALDEEFPV